MRERTDTSSRADSCGDCPVASSRRAFLRDVGVAAAAAIGAMALTKPGLAFAQTVSEIAPVGDSTAERTYAIPRADGAFVDLDNEVLLARWENRVYAFSLKCPHKGARLEWRPSEQRVFCPKHKARFLADGTRVSGRGKRDLDRYALRRIGTAVSVDMTRAYRADRDPTAWAAAVLSL